MEKIKERAERYARKVTGWLPLEDERSKIAIKHYTAGATEQKVIDDAEFGCRAESYETGFAQGQEVGEREQKATDLERFKAFLNKIGRGEKWAAFERFMEEQ